MRLAIKIVIGLCAAAWASETILFAADNQPPEGFVALFDGKEMSGFEVSEQNAQHWKVQDGIIVYDGKGKSLPTAKDYGDFVLMVDWKIDEGADSGIYLRGKPQVQIWDINRNPEGSGGLWNNKKTHKGEKPLVAADNPIGEWNTFKIEMIGDKVTVHLNDKLVVDEAPLETIQKNDSYIKEGPILLQHHGNPLKFRNIYIKEL